MGNDISIITGIISIFLIVGTFLPILSEGFNVTIESNDIDEITANIGNATRQSQDKKNFWEEIAGSVNPMPAGAVTIFDIAGSVFLMFFWTFGALPLWLDLIFVILRIILVLTIARNIWIGGGS